MASQTPVNTSEKQIGWLVGLLQRDARLCSVDRAYLSCQQGRQHRESLRADCTPCSAETPQPARRNSHSVEKQVRKALFLTSLGTPVPSKGGRTASGNCRARCQKMQGTENLSSEAELLMS